MPRPPYRGIIINSQKSLALNDSRLVRLIKSKKRIILCEILLRLGAAVSCKNQFQKTPVEIARCWNRQDLAKFLENPESMMDKIPVTPNMLHAQRTSTPNSIINGISTRTQKLIQKKEREGVHSALIQNRGELFQPILVLIHMR